MSKNYIFRKKYNFKYIFLVFILCFILIFVSILIYLKTNKNNFFIIPSFEGTYFIIPKNKGGAKILNTDKKSLHLNQKNEEKYIIANKENLSYSIQFLVSTDYEEIITFLNNFVNNYENIYIKEDFYVLAFTSDLGIDYYLLYKNFNTKKDAQNYCSKYVFQNNNCLVVNAKNF